MTIGSYMVSLFSCFSKIANNSIVFGIGLFRRLRLFAYLVCPNKLGRFDKGIKNGHFHLKSALFCYNLTVGNINSYLIVSKSSI